MEKLENYGILISSFECHNCNFHTEKTDDIDESSSFTRNEECHNYLAKMTRKKKDEKIIININIECKICNKNSKYGSFENKENKLEFECCGQKKFIFSYFLSTKKEENQLIDDSKINENNDLNINNNNVDNNNNIILNNLDDKMNNINKNNNNKDYKDSNIISDDDSLIYDNEKRKNDNNDVYIKKIDIYPWPNISNENKITIIFKYYKKTEVNYNIHCSKQNYLSDVIKAFKKECGIDSNLIYAICDANKLDGERTIKELHLKDKSLILIR